jgi:cell division protease FtsH
VIPNQQQRPIGYPDHTQKTGQTRDAAARAESILDRNWSAVEETATALLEQETLSGLALQALLSTVQATTLEDLKDVRRATPPRFTQRDGNQHP